jgi:hypothetical protein
MRQARWVVTSLLLALLLVVGCARLPWAKKDGTAPAGEGTEAARLLSEENVLPIVVMGDVWLVPEDGGDAIRVTHTGRASDPVVSADGHALAYVLAVGADDQATQAEDSARAELHVMVLDTGDTFVAATGTPPWGAPSWSPDGAYLAWPLADALQVLQVPSGKQAATYAVQWSGATLPAPVWSADGAVLYYPLVVDGLPVLHALPMGGEPASLVALDPGAAPVMVAWRCGSPEAWCSSVRRPRTLGSGRWLYPPRWAPLSRWPGRPKASLWHLWMMQMLSGLVTPKGFPMSLPTGRPV